MIHIVDHIFMFLLFVVQPIHGTWEYNRYVERVKAGEPPNRVKFYRETFVLEWAAFVVLAATWYLLRRPVADLGFVAPGGMNFWIGVALLVIVSALLLYNWRLSKTYTPEQKAKEKQTFGKLVYILPHTDRDYRLFFGVSITAGIVEETIYRGFALWYLAQFMPIWAAILASSVVFGLGHSYQGASGMVRVTIIGAVFAAFYVFTGSIWLPILGHFLLDALQGLGILEVLREDDEAVHQQGGLPGVSNS